MRGARGGGKFSLVADVSGNSRLAKGVQVFSVVRLIIRASKTKSPMSRRSCRNFGRVSTRQKLWVCPPKWTHHIGYGGQTIRPERPGSQVGPGIKKITGLYKYTGTNFTPGLKSGIKVHKVTGNTRP